MVLTRKFGEAVMIGDNITVRIVGIKGKYIRLRIDAPKEVTIHRNEVYAKVIAERKTQWE